MTETLHHSIVTELTGYKQRALHRFVKDGIIKCERDRFGLPRYDAKVVDQLKARAEKFKRHRAAAKKRRP
jgi:hypothetical protein